jgi:hypothetical protein
VIPKFAEGRNRLGSARRMQHDLGGPPLEAVPSSTSNSRGAVALDLAMSHSAPLVHEVSRPGSITPVPGRDPPIPSAVADELREVAVKDRA